MAYVVGLNESLAILHPLLSLDGSSFVSGEVANFSYVLRDESGNTQTSGVSVAEQSTSGHYTNTFASWDATGVWKLSITNPAGDLATYDYYVQVVQNPAGATPTGTYLTSLANFRERIGAAAAVTSSDALYTNLIARASEKIESICGRNLVAATYTEYCDGGGRDLNLHRGPINSVTSVHVVSYSTAGTETVTAENAGSYFKRGMTDDGWKLPGYIERHNTSWTHGQRNYRVIYNAGFSTVPYDLEEACLHAAVWMWNKRKNAGSAARDVGSGSASFRPDSELDGDLRAMLAAYIPMRVL